MYTTLPESLSIFDKLLFLFLGGHLLNTNNNKVDVSLQSSKLNRHFWCSGILNYFYLYMKIILKIYIKPASLFKHVTPKQMKSRAKYNTFKALIYSYKIFLFLLYKCPLNEMLIWKFIRGFWFYFNFFFLTLFSCKVCLQLIKF